MESRRVAFDVDTTLVYEKPTAVKLRIRQKCQELTLRVTSAMRSVYGKRFFQRLQVGLRSGLACLICGVILQFVDPVTKWLAMPYFAFVICLNVVESSVGAVVNNLIGVFIGMVQAFSVGALCYLIFGTSLSIVPTVIIIFFASFYVCYPAGLLGQEMARKVALALVGIIFTSAHSGANKDSMFFLIRLMVTTLFGAGCAVVSVITPFPGLAFWEFRTSAKATVRGDVELFKSNCEAFCAREVSKLSSVFLHAKYLSMTASTTLNDLNSRKGDVYWELKPWGLLPSCKRLAEGLNLIKLHMMGMNMALQSGLILQYTPVAMSTILRPSLKRLGDRSKSMLEIARTLRTNKNVNLEKERLLDQAREDLKMFDENLMKAREESYYSKMDDTCTLEEEPVSRTAEKCIKHLFQSMVPTYFFLFNLRLYFTEIMKMLNPNSVGKVANEMHKVAKHGGGVPMISHELDQNGVPVKIVVPGVNNQAANPGKDLNKCSGLLAAPCKICEYKNADVPCVGQKKKSWISVYRKEILRNCCNFNWQQALRAAKFSLAMAIAALAGIFYNKDLAFWAVVCVGFIIQNSQGGCFRMANLRLQGTVIGAVYAYLMVIIIHDYPDYVLIPLIPWVILLSYLRFSKLFGPAGVIAGLTAAIVMLGSNGAPIESMSVIRITENFIGVLALIVVESLVFPDRAVVLARKELVLSLTDLRDCVTEVVRAYTGHHCDEHRKTVAAKIKTLEANLRARINEQKRLQAEAGNEPELWNVPFPSEIYARMLDILTRMLDLLHIMVLSFHAVTEEAVAYQIRRLVAPLQGSLDALQDEVASSIHLLQGLLQCPRKKIVLMSTEYSSTSAHRARNLERALSRDLERALSKDVEDGVLTYNLEEMVGKVHPLLVLECVERDIDGTPLSLKKKMKEFEASYETVIAKFISEKKRNPGAPILSNAAMLSFSALTFSLLSLLKETVELEKSVHQLFHFEHPWSVLEFWQPMEEEVDSPSPAGIYRRYRASGEFARDLSRH